MSFERQELQNPRPVIEGIRAEIMATGATDFENNALDEVIREFESGNITAKEAVERAYAIQANRQDYH
ncbi:MAG: hypothetical protein Q8P99_01685 [bacterium]|nr:hypothetical protein [bacterium]